MENEENRGLIYKKAFEDQLKGFFFKPFVNSVLELSHYSLSLSLTLGHLEFLGSFWHWTKKGKKARRRKQARRSKNQATTTRIFADNDLHV